MEHGMTDLTRKASERKGSEYIEKILVPVEVAHASRRLEVTMPPAEIAVDLKISPFEPTVWITSLGYTKSGQVVEYSESYYPASHSSFQIEINR